MLGACIYNVVGKASLGKFLSFLEPLISTLNQVALLQECSYAGSLAVVWWKCHTAGSNGRDRENIVGLNKCRAKICCGGKWV